jgi:hypothetical protein
MRPRGRAEAPAIRDGEAFCFTAGADFDEGLGHAVKAQGMELVESRVFEQDRLP